MSNQVVSPEAVIVKNIRHVAEPSKQGEVLDSIHVRNIGVASEETMDKVLRYLVMTIGKKHIKSFDWFEVFVKDGVVSLAGVKV